MAKRKKHLDAFIIQVLLLWFKKWVCELKGIERIFFVGKDFRRSKLARQQHEHLYAACFFGCCKRSAEGGDGFLERERAWCREEEERWLVLCAALRCGCKQTCLILLGTGDAVQEGEADAAFLELEAKAHRMIRRSLLENRERILAVKEGKNTLVLGRYRKAGIIRKIGL